MKGIGSRLLEVGQSITKVVGDDTQQNIQTTQAQVTGHSIKTNTTPIQQPKVPESMGDFGNLLEQNQTQENTSSNTTQDVARQHEKTQEAMQTQQKIDQAALAAARKNLQQIEQEMESYREKREQKTQQEDVQAEQQEEQEAFWQKEAEKQKPVRAGGNPELKGNKG